MTVFRENIPNICPKLPTFSIMCFKLEKRGKTFFADQRDFSNGWGFRSSREFAGIYEQYKIFCADAFYLNSRLGRYFFDLMKLIRCCLNFGWVYLWSHYRFQSKGSMILEEIDDLIWYSSLVNFLATASETARVEYFPQYWTFEGPEQKRRGGPIFQRFEI